MGLANEKEATQSFTRLSLLLCRKDLLECGVIRPSFRKYTFSSAGSNKVIPLLFIDSSSSAQVGPEKSDGLSAKSLAVNDGHLLVLSIGLWQ